MNSIDGMIGFFLLLLASAQLCGQAMTSQSSSPVPDPVQHPLLAKGVGQFDVAYEIFMAPGKSTKGRGRAEGLSVLDGRFLRIAMEMEFMGRSMRHEVTLGHDAFRKQFDFTWLSNQSGATSRATGEVTPTAAKNVEALTFRGEMHDAMAGKRKVRHVFEFAKGGGLTFSTYDTLPDGKEFKVMVLRFTQSGKKPEKR